MVQVRKVQPPTLLENSQEFSSDGRSEVGSEHSRHRIEHRMITGTRPKLGRSFAELLRASRSDRLQKCDT